MSQQSSDFIQGRSPDFSQVKQVLSACEANVGPAEFHGMICGIICAGRKENSKTWLEPILNAANKNHKTNLRNKKQAQDPNIVILTDLYDLSWQQIRDMEFDFQLLLPDDDKTTLANRAKALSEWCQGFLYSMGSGEQGWDALKEDETVEQESEEILQHLSEIVKLDYDELAGDEEEEIAFTDLVEYLRMSVLMLYYNLHQQTVKDKSIITSHRKTLH